MSSDTTSPGSPGAERTDGPPQPPRERVAADLRRRIRSGELPSGARLPTQQDLEAAFGVRRTVVRQALGMLQDEGLVTMGRGAPATVTGPRDPQPQPPYGPRPAGVLLADRVRAAFTSEHVTVDTYSLTTETLNRALSPALNAVTAGELSPRSVRMRVLLPSPEAQLALPRLVADPEDERPLDRLHRLTDTFVHALRANVDSLRVRDTVETVSLEVRTVPVTPLHKLYLLNGTESLLGYYNVVERQVELRRGHASTAETGAPPDPRPEEIYDVLGLDAELFRSSSGPDGRDGQEAAFVAASQSWFESLWSTIALPFTLG